MRTLIAIPVHNERGTVLAVLERVRAHARDVLVVNDGSTDGTRELLDAAAPGLGIDVLHHHPNRGYGRTLIDAFGHAASLGYDWVITMDCDEQHEPESIPDFMAAIARDDLDIVSGSRYMNLDANAIGAPPPERRRINALLTAEVNDRLGLGLTDAFCGYKAHRVARTVELGLTEPGYAFPMQLWARAAAAGLRIGELPVKLIYNDPNRTFGNGLDDATHRLAHYRAVLHAEICSAADRLPARALDGLDCLCGGPAE